ncbi:MAG: alpha/beta hydrolase [Gemmatimonadaceae bacterium]
MGFIKVGTENSADIELYYEDHGSGKPVILIHGYPLNGASWEKQTAALLKAGCRVITYDRRGFGKSSQPSTGYNYDTFAEDLRKVITTLDLKDVALGGFSMGGGEVARYIGKYGSAGISKAMIISGVPPYLLKAPDNPAGQDKAMFDGIGAAVQIDRFAFFREFFGNFYNADLTLGKLISQQVIDASCNVAAGSSAIADFECVAAWYEDFRKDLDRFDIPTLVMHGDADRILPITATGALSSKMIKGAEYIIVKGAPHGMLWTHADEVSAAMVKFLS